MTITSVCVFCGSSPGRNPAYMEAAAVLGSSIARRGWRLLYGGAQVGLMGVVADAALAAGGQVTGAITEGLLAKEVAHPGISELLVVPTMHERKAVLADRSDAFVMMPGGFGTLDEFFEAATWTQLGIHTRPCGILNVEGYFDGLLAAIDHFVQERFVHEHHAKMLVVNERVEPLLSELEQWRAPVVEKWLDRSQR